MRKKFLNIVLSTLLFMTSLPSGKVYADSGQGNTDDRIHLTKVAQPVDGKLNEWEIDLKIQYIVNQEWTDQEPPEEDEWEDQEPPEEDEWGDEEPPEDDYWGDEEPAEDDDGGWSGGFFPYPMSAKMRNAETFAQDGPAQVERPEYIAVDSIIPNKLYDPMGEGFDLVGMPQVITGSGEVAYEGNIIDWDITADNFALNQFDTSRELHIRYRVKANQVGLEKVRNGEVDLATNGNAKFTYDGGQEGIFPVPTATPTVVEVIKEFDHESIVDNVEEGFYRHEFDFELTGPDSFKNKGTFKFDGENHKHLFNVENEGMYTLEETESRLVHREYESYEDFTFELLDKDFKVVVQGKEIEGNEFELKEGMGLVQFHVNNKTPFTEGEPELSVYKEVYFGTYEDKVYPKTDGKIEYVVHLSVEENHYMGGTKPYIFKDSFEGWDYVQEKPEDVKVTFRHGWSSRDEDILLETTFDKIQDGIQVDLSSDDDIRIEYEFTPVEDIPEDYVYKNIATLGKFKGEAEIGVASYKDLELSKHSIAYEGVTPYDDPYIDDDGEEEEPEEEEARLMRFAMPFMEDEDVKILDVAKPGAKIRYGIVIGNAGETAHKQVVVKDKDLGNIIEKYADSIYDAVSLYVVSNIESFDFEKEGLDFQNAWKKDEYQFEDLIDGITLDIEGESKLVLVFDIELKEDLPLDLELIENTATASDQEAKSKTPVKNFSFNIEKSVKSKDLNSSEEALIGDRLDYTLVLSSDSPEAKEVKLTEDLSGLIEFMQEDPKDVEVTFSNGQKASLQELVDGFDVKMEAVGAVKAEFTVTLKDDIKDGQELVNKASFANKESEATIKTVKTEIKAEKSVKDSSGDGFVEAGELVEYAIKAKNVSDLVSSQFVIKDDLAQVSEYLNVEDSIKVSSSHADINGKKEFTIKELKEGISFKHIAAQEEVVLSFKLNAKEDADFSSLTEIKNIAIVDGKEVEAVIEGGMKDFEISKSFVDANDDKKIQANETIQYIIKIDNTGSLTLENLIVKDELKGLDKVFDIDLDIPVTVNTKASELNLKDLQEGILIKELKTNQSIILEFSLKAKDSLDAKEIASVTNTASVNDKEASVTAEIISPELVFEKLVKDENNNNKAEAGEKLFYTIVVENKGNGISEQTFIKDDLAEVKAHIKDDVKVSIKSNHKEALSLQELMEGFNVDIDASEKLTIDIEVTLKDDFNAKEVEKLNNTAIVVKDEVKAEIETAYSEIAIEKTVKDENNNGKAELNETLTYNIKVSNTSDYDAKDVLIQDDLVLMEDLVKESSDVKVIQNGQELESIALDLLKSGVRYDIKANESIEFVFEVKLIDDEKLWDQLAVAEVSNIAKANEHETEVSIPTGKPIIEVEKEVKDRSEDGLAEAGEVLNYKIIVSNKGDVEAKNVKVQDSLEDLVEHIDDHDENFVEGFVDGKSVLKSNIKELKDGNLLVDIEAGQTVEIIFSVQVKKDFDAKAHDVLTNTVLVAGKQAEASINTGEGKLKIAKEVIDENGNGVAEYGESLKYVIRVSNDGTVAIKDIFVEDKLENLVDHIESTEGVVNVNINDEEELEVKIKDLMDSYHIEGLEPDTFVEFTFEVKLNEELDEELDILNNFATAGDYVAVADIEVKHPLKPVDPETPEVPEEPEVPETPEVPEVPETPETPEVPEKPEVPTEPTVPEAPVVPTQPDMPKEPIEKPVETPKEEYNAIPVSEADKEDLPPTGMGSPLVSAGRLISVVGLGFLIVANNRKKEEE